MKTEKSPSKHSNINCSLGCAAFGAMRAGLLFTAALALLQISSINAYAQDEDVRYSATSGFLYSNGDYGTTRNTNVLIGLLGFGADLDNLDFKISVPYMRISGRGLVVFDAAGNPIIINRRTSLPPDVRTGFGDLNLSGTYSIPAAVLDDFEVKLTGSAKVPIASERKRLSTGEADFGMRVDVSRQYGIWAPFLTVGYLVPGKPSTFKLYNTTSVSAGTSLELSNSLVAVASYDYDSASTPLVAASHEIFASLSCFLSNNMTVTGYGAIGLSSGSPGLGSGLLVSYSLN